MTNKNPPQKNKGLKRFVKAFGYSWEGFVCAFKNEAAFRQELFVCIPLAIVCFFLDFSAQMRSLIIASMLGLLIVELLNSAIEECVNLASPDLHPLAKRAKDMASAAVFLAVSSVTVVWCFAIYSAYLS